MESNMLLKCNAQKRHVSPNMGFNKFKYISIWWLFVRKCNYLRLFRLEAFYGIKVMNERSG